MSSLDIFILPPFIANLGSNALLECDSFHPEEEWNDPEESTADEMKCSLSLHRLYREPRHTVTYRYTECLTLMQPQINFTQVSVPSDSQLPRGSLFPLYWRNYSGQCTTIRVVVLLV